MPASHHSVFTGRMPFLSPNQQRQSTESKCRPVGIFVNIPYNSITNRSLRTFVQFGCSFAAFQLSKFYWRRTKLYQSPILRLYQNFRAVPPDPAATHRTARADPSSQRKLFSSSQPNIRLNMAKIKTRSSATADEPREELFISVENLLKLHNWCRNKLYSKSTTNRSNGLTALRLTDVE